MNSSAFDVLDFLRPHISGSMSLSFDLVDSLVLKHGNLSMLTLDLVGYMSFVLVSSQFNIKNIKRALFGLDRHNRDERCCAEQRENSPPCLFKRSRFRGTRCRGCLCNIVIPFLGYLGACCQYMKANPIADRLTIAASVIAIAQHRRSLSGLLHGRYKMK